MEKTKRIFLSMFVVCTIIIAGAFFYFAQSDDEELFISTTTSVENTGLLDFLINIFEDKNNIDSDSHWNDGSVRHC